MAPTPQVYQTRLHATSLAACPGWTEWALPKLQQLIHGLKKGILEGDLSPDQVMEKREAYKALTKEFLDKLRAEAAGAFDTSIPMMHDELDTTLPERGIIEQTLAMLQHETLVPTSQPKPPPPVANDLPSFDPFAGIPQPILTAKIQPA